jgi:SHS2 domain-containing protein
MTRCAVRGNGVGVVSRGHETVDHAADMGIRGWGGTMSEAFEEIASAMLGLMVDGTGAVPTRRLEVSREGADPVELLLEFLNGLLAEGDLAGLALLDVDVKKLSREEGTWKVEAVAAGVPLADARDRLLVEVKAATFYGASVKEDKPGMWIATCVVDL